MNKPFEYLKTTPGTKVTFTTDGKVYLDGIQVCSHCWEEFPDKGSYDIDGRYCSPGCYADAISGGRE